MTRSYRAYHIEALDRAIQVLKMGVIYPHSDDPIHVKYLEKLKSKRLKQLTRGRTERERKLSIKEADQCGS